MSTVQVPPMTGFQSLSQRDNVVAESLLAFSLNGELFTAPDIAGHSALETRSNDDKKEPAGSSSRPAIVCVYVLQCAVSESN